jgi:hypothetical protein
MGGDYLAVPISRDDFVSDYPEALGEPVGALGFLAFGSAPVQVGQILRRPDFDEVQPYILLVGDTDLYLAFAALDDSKVDGYPPDHVRLRVTEWGAGVDVEAVRERVRSQPGSFFEGVILPPGWRGSAR